VQHNDQKAKTNERNLFVLPQGSQPRLFAAVHLGDGEDIVDFAWNPGPDFAGLFAICLSKGGVHLLELKGSSVVSVAILPSSTAATCCMSFVLT